ncbi:MAG TPA: DegT/DnrJ/EryC1/StrS aminotransferase family protein [Burkholderiales bacterium]|nr:DegT/DnrJ/EryC1/StrS aminotransferase family protein [Burkholderiales bacterium]
MARDIPPAAPTASFLQFARPDIDEDTIAAVADVLRSGWITTGPRTAEFEHALSDYFSGRTVRTFTSATAALEVALLVAGIRPGDEVITTAMSFAATANVILRVGARPVFVDVDLATRNIDLQQVEGAFTSRTRAIMPVHFAGRPVDMDRLYALAKRHRVRVIEDAAHAMGASWRGKRIGALGDLVVFSFHPNKNMTTIEGGALALDDPDEARQVDLHRFHGLQRTAAGELDVELPGGKFNFSDVAAVIGLGQLRRLDAMNARRRHLAARYFERLADEPSLALPARADDGHCWHIFTPLLAEDALGLTRQEFIGRMRDRGIGVGVHYPAIPGLTLYRRRGDEQHACPNAERIGRETVSLPLFPAMSDADVDRVCDAVREVSATAAARRARRA